MKNDDFRYIRQGKQLSNLKKADLNLLEPINLRGSGTKNALLILHGFASSPAVYRYLIPKIKNYDAIVCPALSGHAQSIEEFSQSKAEDWLLTAKQACEELINKYEKVNVLGLSLGGLLACELSHLVPLNHLFLLAPALKLNMPVNRVLKLAQILKFLGFQQIRNRAGNLLSEKHAEISYKKLPVSAIIEMLTLAKKYQWVAPPCPVDLFLGVHDQVISSREVEQLFCNLPDVTIHWLKNSAHVLPLDNDFEEIVECINQYAKGHTPT